MHLNDNLRAVPTSPITEAYSWTADSAQPRGVTARTGGSGEFFDVSQAVPGYPPPLSLRRQLAELVQRDDVHGYTDQLGLAALRSELAAHDTRLYGAEVQPIEPEQVGITAGCNQAFCLAMAALAAPGDQVLLPVPYYFNHDMWLRALQIEPVYLACDAAQQPRLELVADLLGERTRALVLVSPNNPTGAVYPQQLLDGAFDLCREAGIALVLDETYRDFLPLASGASAGDVASSTAAEPVASADDAGRALSSAIAFGSSAAPAAPVPHRLFQRDGWCDTLVHLFSFSKVFCLAGHRVGAIVASHRVLEQVAKAMDCVAICPPRLGQEAALYGLRHLDDWVQSNRGEMATRLGEFHRALEQRPELGWKIASSGAYFAYVRHPWPEQTSRRVAERLAREHSVLALAGSMFGPGQDAFLRIAFANLGQERIAPLAQRLFSAVR